MPTDEQKFTILRITNKLIQLGHEVTWREPITTGPLITTYRFEPSAATRVNQIINSADDLTIALGSDQDILIRMLPGEAVVGISVPNRERRPVLWRETLSPSGSMFIPLNMGTDAEGRLYRDDLTTLPHLLVAGSTGAGKTTCINSMIASFIYWRTPDELQLALSDTKNVEFGIFDGNDNEWCPRATSKYATWQILDELHSETNRRLSIFAKVGARNIIEYNQRQPSRRLPYIACLIDELATILEGDKRGESKIAQSKIGRIVQLSRAAGIHMVAATQRPSVDIVIGSIKNNFPARLSFRLSSGADSRTVLYSEGAEHLINRGDMLYQSPNKAGLVRLHAALARDEDFKVCMEYLKLRNEQLKEQEKENKTCPNSNSKSVM